MPLHLKYSMMSPGDIRLDRARTGIRKLDQAVLAEFIRDGHFGHHFRRIREIYAERLEVLREAAKQRLSGGVLQVENAPRECASRGSRRNPAPAQRGRRLRPMLNPAAMNPAPNNATQKLCHEIQFGTRVTMNEIPRK